MNKKIEEIIKQAIDIHYHIGPEIIPRKFSAKQLVEKEKGRIGGFVLKNHFYSTSPLIKDLEIYSNVKLFGGIVLNNFVGGLNTEAIYASSLITPNPIMVWFPTINAENFLNKSEYEIAPEWANNNFFARKANDVKGIRIVENGVLTRNTLSVLKTIKQCNAVLATGHISWEESNLLAQKARKMGIQVVVTHPIYQRINMPIRIQEELAKKGCFIEQSYSMYSIDKIPIKEITQQIKDVGSQSVILSSDMGQPFSPMASTALLKFCKLLITENIKVNDLYTMLVLNPKKLLNIA